MLSKLKEAEQARDVLEKYEEKAQNPTITRVVFCSLAV